QYHEPAPADKAASRTGVRDGSAATIQEGRGPWRWRMLPQPPVARRPKRPLMSCISSQLSSSIKLVSLDDFRHRERPDLDMTQCNGGFPGGEAPRLLPAGLDAGRRGEKVASCKPHGFIAELIIRRP